MNRSARLPLHTDRRITCRRPRLAAAASLVAACFVAGLPVAIRAESAGSAVSPHVLSADDGATVTALVAQLKHPSSARRCEALLRLSDQESPPDSLQSHVWTLLKDPDPLVRAQAARVVWLVGNRTD
ncbi:MAG TPA: hypothetical protein VL475_16325, partial [Planctomycetaceae bacterium]|nr:hypothetical protein [Planctomycetaceae bacterium]